jgi:predicted acylesterase/phospholipase RssA
MAEDNGSQHKVEYLDYRNSPNLLATDAVKMSCNLPPIFRQIIYNGSVYADGGLVDNFPVDALSTDGEILGSVTSTIDVTDPEDSFINYLYRVITLPIDTNTKLMVEKAKQIHNMTLVRMVFKGISPIDFGLNVDKRASIFNQGYIDAKSTDTKRMLNVLDWVWNDVWGDGFDFI